ncbi:MAG: hypothetical protein CM15mP62_06520 [Rhodospirillaceae bacterium]|nr:MAG: hypothetical protein CM15mP62_06520 [Rhodospirillaceae bacterium]
MDKSLVQLTASEVVEGLKKGEISPDDLSTETRILETEPAINALPTLCFRKSPSPRQGFDGKGTNGFENSRAGGAASCNKRPY